MKMQIEQTTIANARLPESYEQAKTALASCARLDECQRWADKAEALASYARQAGDDTLRVYADRIQGRAIRRCGELLKQFDGRGAHMKNDPGVISQKMAATASGISESQRVAAVRVASIPADEFEAAIDSDTPPTVNELARMGTKSRPSSDDESVVARSRHVLSALKNFAHFCDQHAPDPAAAMVMRLQIPEAKRYVAQIDAWLDTFVVNLERTG